MKIGSLTSIANATSAAKTAGEGVTAKAKADPKVHKAAQEFESMFVRQILATAKIGGGEKKNAYNGMATDALANGITQGGGLGLSRQIEDALSHAASATKEAPQK